MIYVSILSNKQHVCIPLKYKEPLSHEAKGWLSAINIEPTEENGAMYKHLDTGELYYSGDVLVLDGCTVYRVETANWFRKFYKKVQ